MNTAQRRSRAYVQLINSKVSGCCLVVCEQCGCLSPRLTHQASVSSIFASTSPPLCPSAIHWIINIYSFWLDFSVGEFSIPHHAGWLLEERRRGLKMATSILMRVASKCVSEACGVQDVRCAASSVWHHTPIETNVTYRTNQIGVIKIKTCWIVKWKRRTSSHQRRQQVNKREMNATSFCEWEQLSLMRIRAIWADSLQMVGASEGIRWGRYPAQTSDNLFYLFCCHAHSD